MGRGKGATKEAHMPFQGLGRVKLQHMGARGPVITDKNAPRSLLKSVAIHPHLRLMQAPR